MKVYRVTLLLDEQALDFVSEARSYSEGDEVFEFEDISEPFEYELEREDDEDE